MVCGTQSAIEGCNMISEDKKYQCWLSDGDRILSFHPVLGYILHEFDSHEEFIRFIFEAVDVMRCRAQ